MEEFEGPFCGNPDHAGDADEKGCIACQDEEAKAKKKGLYDAHVKKFASKAREYLQTEGLSSTEACRAYWCATKAKSRAAKPEYDRTYDAKRIAMGLAPEQAFISATPAHLKFERYAALTSHAAIRKASGGALSLDHVFPRNRLKGNPPALGLHVTANLQCITPAENLGRKNTISRTDHRKGLEAGIGALLESFASLDDGRLIYQGPRPAYIPDEGRIPYRTIDRNSLINIELPEGEDEEAFLERAISLAKSKA